MMNENKPGVYKLRIPFFTKLGERSKINRVLYTKEPIVKAIEKMKSDRENIFVTIGRVESDDLIKRSTIDLETIVGTMDSYDDEGFVVAIKSESKYNMVKSFVDYHGYKGTISMMTRIVYRNINGEPSPIIDPGSIPKIICIDVKPPRKETEE